MAKTTTAQTTKRKKQSKRKAPFQAYGLRQATEARLLGVSQKTASSIRGGSKPSEPTKRRLAELTRLLNALSEIVSPTSIREWLREPNEALAGLSPLETIERGEVDRIWQLIYALRSGEPL